MIEIKALHFTYPGSQQEMIKGIDFTIEKGEIFGFLGPSGAGKSTTQKIMIGILKNYQGHVKVNHQEVKEMKANDYEKMGVVFEVPNFYSKLTALENLKFFGSLYSGKIQDPQKLLSQVGLEKDAHTRVAHFSKGMKMRLNFCRAFLHQPDIIFLDEPTSGLDPVNAKIIKNLILEQKAQGKTIFLNTHNMNVAEEICDRVAFIVDGQISLIDRPRDLKINRGKRIIRVEFKENQLIRSEEFDLKDIASNPAFMTLLQSNRIETIHTLYAKTFNYFIMMSVLYLTVLFVPLLSYVNLVDHALFYLIPTTASIILIQSAFMTTTILEQSYALGFMSLSIVMAYYWAYKLFQKHIVLKIGADQ